LRPTGNKVALNLKFLAPLAGASAKAQERVGAVLIGCCLWLRTFFSLKIWGQPQKSGAGACFQLDNQLKTSASPACVQAHPELCEIAYLWEAATISA